MANLTEFQYKQFIQLLNQGYSILKASKILNISPKTGYRICKQNNLQPASFPETLNKEQIISILNYWKNHTNAETRNEFNLSENHLYDIIKHNNLPLKNNRSHTNINTIDKEDFINYYQRHSYRETISFFGISEGQIKKLIKKFNCEKREKDFDSFLNNLDINNFLKDYYELSNKELQNRYNISEAFYYKIIQKYNLDKRKRANNNINTVLSTINQEQLKQYLKSHTILETSSHFNIATNIVCNISKLLLGNRNYKKETTDEVINKILKSKDEFLQDYYSLSLQDLYNKWHFHSRRLKAIETALNIPHRQLKMDLTIKTNTHKYGVPYACMREEAKNLKGRDSKPNLDFKKLLDNYSINYTCEYPINKFIYDFKINNTLIEINPARTHSPDITCYGRTIKQDYHKYKTYIANQANLRCIHIWEWDNQEKIIKNFLVPKETIYARKCEVKEISKEEAKHFIDKYHIQNYAHDIIRLGLLYNNTLVSVMTFGTPRYNKNFEYELIRYCSLAKVIGGSEKLFKFFIDSFSPKSIISYCDNSKFNGDTYIKLGFKLKSQGKPSCHWYNHNTSTHITNNLLLQRGFDQLFKTNYGKGTSNEQLMLDKGFIRVYDCGQSTYTWRCSNEIKNSISQ